MEQENIRQLTRMRRGIMESRRLMVATTLLIASEEVIHDVTLVVDICFVNRRILGRSLTLIAATTTTTVIATATAESSIRTSPASTAASVVVRTAVGGWYRRGEIC